MRREIKFQVWDTVGKEMLTCSDRCQIKLNGNVLDWYSDSEFGPQERYIIRQYTGVRDKNNDEIYEGDVVTTGILRGEVVFKHCVWLFDGHPLGTYCNELVICGNVYENPESLK
jgi:uncharacterized phage protein (TIGR01671 family)